MELKTEVLMFAAERTLIACTPSDRKLKHGHGRHKVAWAGIESMSYSE